MAEKRKWNPVSYKRTRRVTAFHHGLNVNRIERIVSGGQTGVDRAALDFAIEHGIPHGGWCPRGRWAEDGAIEDHYELNETPDRRCAQRTEWNVRDSDGTVIFTIAARLSGGSALTQKLAVLYRKPCLHLAQGAGHGDARAKLQEFIQHEGIKVLNVAGPRVSTEPEAAAFAAWVLEGLCK